MHTQEDAGREQVSVVVSTCAQGERAARCVASILACEPPPLEVIVVENRPAASATAALLADRFGEQSGVRVLAEPRKGLSSARNAGLTAARGEIVAFTDDDVVVEGGWIAAIARCFSGDREVACTTGPILALSLQTGAQRTFERFARLGKGGVRQVYSIADPPADDVLFPYAAGRFGSGANIAMRTGFARSLGGFDVSLGAGTPARGGEDLDLFVRVLRAGAKLVYEPRAAVRHEHVDSAAQLRRRAFRYGVGLSAMATKHLIAEPAQILRRLPAGLRRLLDPSSPKNAAKGAGYPRRLDALELIGIAVGPLAYLASAWKARR